MSYNIHKILNGTAHINKVIYEPVMDSTNLVAKQCASAGEEEGVLVLCDSQTAGRGRLGRKWCNGDEKSIAMSLILRPEIAADSISMITIIAALAFYDAVKVVVGVETDIKWPNDLKYKGKKLCGILTEGVFAGKEYYAVLGVGMNVYKTGFPEELKDIACSLEDCCDDIKKDGNREISGKFDREDIIIAALKFFYKYYEILLRDGNLRNLRELYNSRCINKPGINDYGEYISGNGMPIRTGEI